MSGETVILSGEEADLLARRLVALHLEDHHEWLDFDDVPHLDEQSFAMLGEAVAGLASALWLSVADSERAADLHRAVS